MKRTLLDPLYHQRVDMCDTREDWVKALNRRCRQSKRELHTLDEFKHDAGIVTDVDGVLLMGVFDGDLSTLAHECVHLSTATLRNRGIPITHQNDEALAYMVGWYFKAWVRRMK